MEIEEPGGYGNATTNPDNNGESLDRRSISLKTMAGLWLLGWVLYLASLGFTRVVFWDVVLFGSKPNLLLALVSRLEKL